MAGLCQICSKGSTVLGDTLGKRICSSCSRASEKGDSMEVYERVLEYVTRMRGQTEREKNKLTCQLEFLKQWDAQLFELPFADLWLKPADGSPCVAANRTILAGKSPVFKAMMTSNMKEQRTGVVELENISEECLRAFVHFIYTAEVDEAFMTAKWEELLDLAVKYDVKALQSRCVDHILSNVISELPKRVAPNGTDDKLKDGGCECTKSGQRCEPAVRLLTIGHKYELRQITEAVMRHMISARGAENVGYHFDFLDSMCYR